jgi:hypothetical protein
MRGDASRKSRTRHASEREGVFDGDHDWMATVRQHLELGAGLD